jgi:hypothetical protein
VFVRLRVIPDKRSVCLVSSHLWHEDGKCAAVACKRGLEAVANRLGHVYQR